MYNSKHNYNYNYNDNSLYKDVNYYNNATNPYFEMDSFSDFTPICMLGMAFMCCCFGIKIIHRNCMIWINIRRERVKTPRLDYINLNNGIIKFETCVICLEQNDSKSVTLNCSHIYHKKCIKKWIDETRSNNTNINCPLCKATIV